MKYYKIKSLKVLKCLSGGLVLVGLCLALSAVSTIEYEDDMGIEQRTPIGDIVQQAVEGGLLALSGFAFYLVGNSIEDELNDIDKRVGMRRYEED